MKYTLTIVVIASLLAVVPVLAQEAQPKPEAKPAESAESLPSATQILDNYVEKLGGKAALEKLTSRSAKGSFEVPEFGASGTLEMHAKAPNKIVLIIDVPGFGVVQQGYDGKIGWDQNPQTGLTELSGADLESKKLDSDFYRAIHLKELYPTLTVKGKEKVADRDAYLVEAKPASGVVEKWYFDVENSLLVRVDAERSSPQGSAVVESYFSDYRDVDGVKFPFGIRQVMPGLTIMSKLDEVKNNVDIEDAKFAKPAN